MKHLDSTQIKSLYETGKMPESVEEESRALSYDEVKSKMAEEKLKKYFYIIKERKSLILSF